MFSAHARSDRQPSLLADLAQGSNTTTTTVDVRDALIRGDAASHRRMSAVVGLVFTGCCDVVHSGSTRTVRVVPPTKKNRMARHRQCHARKSR